MLAYVLGITKRGNKGITNWGQEGFQIGPREITNLGKDFKSWQGLQILVEQITHLITFEKDGKHPIKVL